MTRVLQMSIGLEYYKTLEFLKKVYFIFLLLATALFYVNGQTANPQQYKYVCTVAKDGDR
jgi:hypothetical protein